MKTVGVIKKIHKMGVLVIPQKIRSFMGIGKNDYLEYYTEPGQIIMKKHEPYCLFCGDDSDCQEYHGKMVCRKCVEAIFENVKTG